MIVKGRCRGNGSQLAHYLMHSSDNDRADFLSWWGIATPNDLKRSLLEMSLTSEITGKTNAGLYHVQISPRDHEAAGMTWEQKMRSVEIMTEHLGLNGHKWVLVEHEKEGRIHLHLAFERYNHDTGRMWDDNKNYAKHKSAARQMELEFGHELTHDKTNHLDKYAKAYILNIWENSLDAASFKKVLWEKAGFELVQGIDNRPFKIVDQSGKSHDLAQQLKDVKQREVSERLNPIRKTLRTETEAIRDYRKDADIKQELSDQKKDFANENQHVKDQNKDKEEPKKQSDKKWDLSDSQTTADRMRETFKQSKQQPEPAPQPKKEQSQSYAYSFKFEQPPPRPHQPDLKSQSDKNNELSDSQDLADDMLNRQKAANDNGPLAKYRSDENSPLANYRAGKSIFEDERSNDNSPLEKYRDTRQSPLAKLRHDDEESPLNKFRSEKDNQTRPHERMRERDEDGLKC